jgi:osmotically-inducible protein OsmY
MRKMFKYLMAMAAGAAAAMLMDPVRGRSRRARLMDQAGAQARDLKRQMEQRARYERGRVKGMAHEMTHDEAMPTDDETLRQKVRSEALGPAGATNLEVDVENGTVTLIGDIPDNDVLRRVRSVTGVADVRVRTGRNV